MIRIRPYKDSDREKIFSWCPDEDTLKPVPGRYTPSTVSNGWLLIWNAAEKIGKKQRPHLKVRSFDHSFLGAAQELRRISSLCSSMELKGMSDISAVRAEKAVLPRSVRSCRTVVRGGRE